MDVTAWALVPVAGMLVAATDCPNWITRGAVNERRTR